MTAVASRAAPAPSPPPFEPSASPAPTGGPLRRLRPFLGSARRDLGVALGAAVVGQLANGLGPLVQKVFVDDVMIGRTRPALPWLGLMLVTAGVTFGLAYVRRWVGGRVALTVQHNLRTAIFDRLMRLDFAGHDRLRTGQLVSRSSSDLGLVQQLLSTTPLLLGNLVLVVVSVVAMLALSPELTIVTAVVLPILAWLSLRLRALVFPATWEAQQRAGEVAGVVDEAVSGVRIVKGFGAEEREVGRLGDAAEALFRSRVRLLRVQARTTSALAAVPAFAQVGVLALGGWLALQGRLSLGTFLAFSTYLVQLVAPMRMMAAIVATVEQARAGSERVLDILDANAEVVDAPDAVALGPVRGEVRFEDVRFGYERSHPVLDGFDLHVQAGEIVALVGSSGSGKSTVGALLPRFYDVADGRVTIDGVDVRSVTLESLRAQVGVAFEDAFLFSDTIRANIAYGRPDASDDDVRTAARIAGAEVFVDALPDGFDTVVGERGLTLSGGQRQRVALARAIVGDPRVLLLDAATSAVDTTTEEAIHAALQAVLSGRTTILVAHRASTVRLADRVVVVDGGRVVDEGTHDELARRNATYRALLGMPDDDIADEPPATNGAGHVVAAPDEGTAPSAGATPGGAPANGNGARPHGDGAPANGNGARPHGDGATPDDTPTSHHGAAPSDGARAPANRNGAPPNGNGAPAIGNGAPAIGNGAPANGNGNGAPAIGNGAVDHMGVTPAAWPPPPAEAPTAQALAVGDGAGGRRAGGNLQSNLAPTPRLLAALDRLPPADARSGVDLVAAAQEPPEPFRLGRFIRPWRRLFVIGLVLVATDAFLTALGPVLIRHGIDAGVRADEVQVLWTTSIAFGIVTAIDWLVTWAGTYLTGRTAEAMLLSLRVRIFAHLQRLSLDYFDNELDGRIMTRMTSDVDALSQLVQSGLVNAVVGVATCLGVAVFLVIISPPLALAAAAVVPLLWAATNWYRHRASAAYRASREAIASVNANLQENLSGVRVAQANRSEERSAVRFRALSGDYLDARMRSQRLLALYFPAIGLLADLAAVAVLAAGDYLVGNGDVTPGVVIAFVLYLNLFFAPIQQLSQVFDTWQQAASSTTKITELLTTDSSTPPPDHPVALGPVRGEVAFEGVAFRYPVANRPAVHDLDFTIAAGETVALVGETGAGKSTIVRLIARFADPTAGRVLVDGVDLRAVDLTPFRRRLGLVPQEPFLFTGTVRDNIAYGRPEASDAEVEAAARAVGAHGFIAAMADGYRTAVSERGRSLSAGERQLIALARAQLVDPAILLLDEATANLDMRAEATVRRAMSNLAAARTTVLVAHRLATASTADRIFVLDDGRLAEVGSHQELLARGGIYRRMWDASDAAKGDGAPAQAVRGPS